jgi:hypothetical protein
MAKAMPSCGTRNADDDMTGIRDLLLQVKGDQSVILSNQGLHRHSLDFTSSPSGSAATGRTMN